MNERIKELAEQAGSTHKQSLGVYQFYEFELEKFAELIVRECAVIARLNTRVDSKVYLMIQEHFGVEG